MNYTTISNVLESDYDKVRVQVYIEYIKNSAKDVSKNPWVRILTDDQAVDLFRKVALDGVFIDGETITIQARKNTILISYGYQAYKNRMLKVYPESKVDLQLVHKGDEFSFKKESGQVLYTHNILNPFEKDREIIGAYCVIKNSRGEFLTTLDMEEIKKMRSVANTQYIWNQWEGEMIKKSVIKRACKTHFNDSFVGIEKADNEQYDLDGVGLDHEVLEAIENATSKADLDAIYKKYQGLVNKANGEPQFLKVLSKRKVELKKQSA